MWAVNQEPVNLPNLYAEFGLPHLNEEEKKKKKEIEEEKKKIEDAKNPIDNDEWVNPIFIYDFTDVDVFDLILKKYKKLSILGEGGFGAAYKVIHIKEYDYYAIKEENSVRDDREKVLEHEYNMLTYLADPKRAIPNVFDY